MAGFILKSTKNLSESHEFCLVSFRNGATVISQSTVKIVFFRCLTNLILLSNFFQGKGDENQNIKIFGQIMLQVNDNIQKTRSESEFWLKNAKLQLWWLLKILGFWPFNFEGLYLLHCWEKVFLAGLIWKNKTKSLRSS